MNRLGLLAAGGSLLAAGAVGVTLASFGPESPREPQPGPTSLVVVLVPAPTETLVVPGPTETVKVPVPGPTKTVEVSRSGRDGWSLGLWDRWPAAVEAAARCVAHHESWTSGLWDAENPTSTAAGAFQFVDGTWQAMVERAGLPFTRHASQATAADQAAAFAWAYLNHQYQHWAGTGCF